MEKYSYEIDVPVLLIFFNRPGCFGQVFEQVRKARPSKLFLYQDGARENNEKDKIGVEKCREIASQIDWDCEVKTLYQEKNYGCDPSGYLARKWAFSYVDSCIILEDDCVPCVSYFEFCRDLLERYAEDQRINMICGMNNLETWDSPYSYLFTETGSICGVATWRRVFDEWDTDYSLLSDSFNRRKLIELMKVSGKNTKSRLHRWDEDKRSGIEYHEALGGIAQYTGNRLNIVSTKNMIINNGNTFEGGTHSTNSNNTIPHGLRSIFTMKQYEMDFPLKHPKYIINDVEYQKKLFRLMGWGHPFITLFRRIEKSLLIIRYEGVSSLVQTIQKKLRR